MKHIFSRILGTVIQPFYGSGLGNFFPFKQLNHFYVHISQEQELVIETIGGFKMALQRGKYIDRVILSEGQWEPHITKLIQSHLKEGDTFIDVGANIGYDTLLGAICVGENGTVLSFEPAKSNYERLSKNIGINGIQNIQTFQFGLGNIPFQTEIYLNDINPGAASILSFRKQDTNIHTSTVEIRVFDEVFPDQKCDLIKIDVEGYELEAFEGMRKLLTSNEAIKILFEYSPVLYEKADSTGNTGIKILTFLKDLRFSLYHISGDGELRAIHDIDSYAHEIRIGGGQSDLYCSR